MSASASPGSRVASGTAAVSKPVPAKSSMPGSNPVAASDPDAEGVVPVAAVVGDHAAAARVGSVGVDRARVVLEGHALRLVDAPARVVAEEAELEVPPRAHPQAGAHDVRQGLGEVHLRRQVARRLHVRLADVQRAAHGLWPHIRLRLVRGGEPEAIGDRLQHGAHCEAPRHAAHVETRPGPRAVVSGTPRPFVFLACEKDTDETMRLPATPMLSGPTR